MPPTIEFIGFRAVDATHLKNETFRALKDQNSSLFKDTVIICISNGVNNRHETIASVEDSEGNQRPFARVYAMQEEDFQQVRKAITTNGACDIEYIKMEAFYPMKK